MAHLYDVDKFFEQIDFSEENVKHKICLHMWQETCNSIKDRLGFINFDNRTHFYLRLKEIEKMLKDINWK